MSIEYSWKLIALKKEDVDASHPQSVVHAKWSKTGTDESGKSATFQGACRFSVANVSPENFIPYDELTDDIILGWVQDILNRGGMDRVDKTIIDLIEESKTTQSSPYN